MTELVPIQRVDNGDGTVTWRTRTAHREFQETEKASKKAFYLNEPPQPIMCSRRCIQPALKDPTK